MQKKPACIRFAFRRISLLLALITGPLSAQQLIDMEALTQKRAEAHLQRYQDYLLNKLQVIAAVQSHRGMCLDFIGDGDGLYRSTFSGGPLMVDVADCGSEGRWIDGRVRALRVTDPLEYQNGISHDQVNTVIERINTQLNGHTFPHQP
ncbi:hypothetical protein OAS86_02315 [Gammaproteobacteria bacterium]|nr:hypothetical protein [Gammaproteobacteria bacterium]